jgi:methionine-gamma-lyase
MVYSSSATNCIFAMMNKDQGFATLCIHGGFTQESNRAHITPIYATSTFLFDDAQQIENVFTGKEEAFVYSRWNNPTVTEVEKKIALLECYGIEAHDGTVLTSRALLHNSGMSALTTLFMSTLKKGDKILSHFSLYGGTQELFDKVLSEYGVVVDIIDFDNVETVAEALKTNAYSLVYIETPANPTLRCVDIKGITALAKQYNCKVAVDNTFATAYLQQPFRFGVDFVFHSTTKFMNGHGTAIGGVLIGTDLEFMDTRATKFQRLLGGSANAFEAYLLNNGLKTLELRMDRHCANAQAVADFLYTHSSVDFVNYLGLSASKYYHLASAQMTKPGAMLSFELKGGYEDAKKFINSVNLCNNAVSLGTADTILCHSASTTHVGVPRELRIASGITDGLIRISVGLENIGDILTDLDQALSTL